MIMNVYSSLHYDNYGTVCGMKFPNGYIRGGIPISHISEGELCISNRHVQGYEGTLGYPDAIQYPQTRIVDLQKRIPFDH